MAVQYNRDGTIVLTEVDQETGEEIVNGRRETLPAGMSKEDQDAAIAAFFFPPD